MLERLPLTFGTIAGIITATAVALVYQSGSDLHIDFERGYEAPFVENFYPRERTGETYFRWTRGESFINFNNLPRQGTLTVAARIRVLRPVGVELPTLAFTANGITVYRAQGLPGLATYDFTVPSNAADLRLGVESDTFVVAGADGERELGVQIAGIKVGFQDLQPSWYFPAFFLALATILFYGTAYVASYGALSSVASAVLLGLGFAVLLSKEAVRFTDYATEVAMLALVTLAVVVSLRLVVNKLSMNIDPKVLGLIGLMFLVKFGALTYPLWLSSDAEFQANRFLDYLSGDWYPTSVTQHDPPFRIPYPVSLFAISEPLLFLGIDRVRALSVVILCFDLIAGIAVLYGVYRFLDDLRAGVLAFFLYQVAPVGLLVLSAGNFTNLFALSITTIGFVFLIFTNDVGSKYLVLATAGLALVGMTAHFGMLLEGLLLWPLWTVCVFWLFPYPAGPNRRVMLIVCVGASIFVVAAYYIGYWPLVADQWQRTLGSGDTSLGFFSRVANQAQFSFSVLRDLFGEVILLIATLGGVFLLRGRLLSSPLHLGVAIWIMVTALFFLIDMVTPLEIRYWFQALPVVSILGGMYLSSAFERGLLGKIAVCSAVVYLSATYVQLLYECMLLRYH